MSNSIQFVLKSALFRSYLGRPESPADVGRGGSAGSRFPGAAGVPSLLGPLGPGRGVSLVRASLRAVLPACSFPVCWVLDGPWKGRSMLRCQRCLSGLQWGHPGPLPSSWISRKYEFRGCLSLWCFLTVRETILHVSYRHCLVCDVVIWCMCVSSYSVIICSL